jgi:GT2 family glycosyltransferase
MNPLDADATRPDASVIVVTHNNESLIGDCLKSIKAALRVASYEIVVVDNYSTDGTLTAVAEHGAMAIALEQNLGFAAATNAGIEASRGRLIVLVNSDAFPDPGSIDRLIETIDELPRAGIVGGRLRYPTGEQQPSVGTFPSLLGGLWVALLLHRLPFTARAGIGVSTHPALYRSRRAVDWVTAAFCIARRQAGPMPTDTFMYGEDVAWAHECHRAGWEVWFDPSATAVHIGRASVDQSQDPGFAQRRRAQFELQWFAHRGRSAELAARTVLILHAVVRLALYGGSRLLGQRADRHISEQVALLRSAVSPRKARRRSEAGPRRNPIL